MGRVLSVNVSTGEKVEFNGRVVGTGIFKKPVEGRVMLRRHQLDGDEQGDPNAHGGPEKAVYAYPYEHYAFWSKELERDDLEYAQFGENLTTQGLMETGACVGDVYRIGDAVVRVIQPRLPCFKFGIRMGGASIIKRFLEAGRPGIYFGVVEEGAIGAGDAIERIEEHPARVSIDALHRIAMLSPFDPDIAQRALSIDMLPQSWRDKLQKRLTEESGAPVSRTIS